MTAARCFLTFVPLTSWSSVEGFPTQEGTKVTWVSPDSRTENKIDHICVSSKFRRSVLDVRVKRGADVASDHHLFMSRCLHLHLHRLKLKNYNTGPQRTSCICNIEMLKDDEKKKTNSSLPSQIYVGKSSGEKGRTKQ